MEEDEEPKLFSAAYYTGGGCGEVRSAAGDALCAVMAAAARPSPHCLPVPGGSPILCTCNIT